MDSKEFEKMLEETETRLDRLRALYEQWFQGLERLEPLILRKDCERRLQLLFRNKPRNTALRFRYQQLQQKWTTYLMYWTRVGRQIEEGTYRRDILRARKKREDARTGWKKKSDDLDIDIDVVEEGAEGIPSDHPPAPPQANAEAAPESSQPVRAPVPLPTGILGGRRPSITPFARDSRPPFEKGQDVASSGKTEASQTFIRAAEPHKPAEPQSRVQSTARSRGVPPPPPPPSSSNKSLSDADMRRIYDKYIEERRRNKEPDVKFETLAKSLREMEPKYRQKFGAKQVDFDVILQGGKVALKPIPKK